MTVDCIVIFCIIDVCIKNYVNYLIYGIVITSLLLPYKRKNRFQHTFAVCICLCSVSRIRLCKVSGKRLCSLPGSRYPLPFIPSVGKWERCYSCASNTFVSCKVLPCLMQSFLHYYHVWVFGFLDCRFLGFYSFEFRKFFLYLFQLYQHLRIAF